MRKRFVFVLVMFLFPFSRSGAQVYNGDLLLNTQAQVDAFNYTSVTGALRLLSANITNLNGLSELTSIGDDFYIGSTSVTNVDPLSNLISVGDLVAIGYNTNLTNLHGLISLTTIGGFLSITENPVLTDLSGLSGLTSLGKGLSLSGNSALTDLNVFSDFTSLGSLSIDDCNALTNLDAFSNLTSVDDNLEIKSNAALTNINGLSNLTSIGRDLNISSNFNLTNIDGLSNLSDVGRNLTISNSILDNLNGLSSLNSIGGGLNIVFNSRLINLDGLSSLNSIGGLNIISNRLLIDIDVFSSLTSLDSLDIENNPALSNINGLSNLASVNGHFDIINNDALIDINGLSKLEEVGGLGILFNLVLTNLDGLSKLKKVGFHFTMSGNAALANIDGLSNLTTIGGNLGMNGNTLLTNLDGFIKLSHVGNNLGIINHPALMDFCGLYLLFNSGTIEGSITIENNGANTIDITTPGPVVVNNDPNVCSAIIPNATIGVATPVGCVPDFTTKHTDFPPGNIFPVGTTQITWTVTDGAGNTAAAVQTITVIDNQPPTITCPANITVKCASDVPDVDINSVTAIDNCLAVISHVSDVISDQTCANRFTLTRTYKATDVGNNTATCSQVITVYDDIPPQITGYSASKQMLWPPNHSMRDITLDYTANDNCTSNPVVTVTVTSNEPVNGTGDGDTDPDWQIIDDHHIKLRAERAANGDGRIYTITVTIDDGCNPPVSQSKQVMVTHNITGPQSGKPFKVGSIVNFSGVFQDKPGNTHTAKWLLDGSVAANGTVIEPSGNVNGKVSGSYKFNSPGVYKLQMNVTDQTGVTSYANTNNDLDAIVVIYDPNGGNTYGGGYFNSPAGALRADPSATGKASYGFAMNYFKNSTNPKGETQFEFKVGEFEFNALNFDYLVISNSMAQFKGTGKIIGGQSGIGFTMTVTDGQLDGSGTDKIRMKIYNKNNGAVIYDNQPGASDAALPTQAVGTNSMVVISGNNSSLTSASSNQKAEMEIKALEVSGDLEVIAFPNPSKNSFSVKVNTKANERITMQVMDMYGRMIETRAINANSITRFGDHYRPGTYFVKLIQYNQHKEIKLVKLSD